MMGIRQNLKDLRDAYDTLLVDHAKLAEQEAKTFERATRAEELAESRKSELAQHRIALADLKQENADLSAALESRDENIRLQVIIHASRYDLDEDEVSRAATYVLTGAWPPKAEATEDAKDEPEGPRAPFEFQTDSNEELTLEMAVGQALGAASTAWTGAPRGVFESEFALSISEALLSKIRAEMDGPGYHVELGGQRFTEAQWEAVQRYAGGNPNKAEVKHLD